MRKFLITIVLTIAASLNSANAGEVMDQQLRLVDFVFPQTISWPLISTYPHPTNEWLKHAADILTPARKCFNDYDNSRFYRIILPQEEQLIYIGTEGCHEATVSIIWQISDSKIINPVIHDGEIVRIQAEKPHAYTAISVGCCAGPTSTYILDEGSHHEYVSTLSALEVPKSTKKIAKEYITPGFMHIRYSPQVKDTYGYEGLRSADLNEKVFGNIMLSYYPLTKITAIAEYVDGENITWLLVKIAPNQGKLLYYSPYPFDENDEMIGWTKASCLTQKCDAEPVNP